MNQKLIISILSLFFFGCYTTTKDNYGSHFGTKDLTETKANQVNLFSQDNYYIAPTKKSKKSFSLFYDKDELRRIVFFKKNRKVIREFTYHSKDKLLLSISNAGRYIHVDSIVFDSSNCYWKQVTYVYNSQNRWIYENWAGMTMFRHYFFQNDSLFVSSESYVKNDSIKAFQNLNEFISTQRNRLIERSNIRLMEVETSNNNSKLFFFRRYIYSY